PAWYLDEQIRRGISSFSSLSGLAEVKKGLAKLANDLANNRFEKIKKQYETDLGDYLFLLIDRKGSS
ncbi:MAG TPA: class I SAM-dependent methyltransferase, partial [Hymenobacter sp.]